jgi:hypothetical protein
LIIPHSGIQQIVQVVVVLIIVEKVVDPIVRNKQIVFVGKWKWVIVRLFDCYIGVLDMISVSIFLVDAVVLVIVKEIVPSFFVDVEFSHSIIELTSGCERW